MFFLSKLLNIAQKCGKILVFLMNNHSDLTNDPVAQPGIYHVIHITIIKLVNVWHGEGLKIQASVAFYITNSNLLLFLYLRCITAVRVTPLEKLFCCPPVV